MMNWAMNFIHVRMRVLLAVSCISLALFFIVAPGGVWAAAAANKLVAVDINADEGSPVLKVTTENPVGYRYTVYDSIDPIRVVIDFPGMDVSEISAATVPGSGVVKEVKVSSFDLTSGKLGRLEIILEESIAYDVALADNVFTMSFDAAQPDEEIASVVVDQNEIAEQVEVEEVAEVEETAEPVSQELSAPASDPVVSDSNASIISNVSINDSSLTLDADGHIEIFKYFKLGAPPRLVVDVYGVKTGFKSRKFDLGEGFSQMRVGTYDDKTRFVLDAINSLPEYSVESIDNSVQIAWGDSAGEEIQSKSAPTVSGVPANVEAVDFDIEDNQSVVRVTLNTSAAIIEPTIKDDIVGFGVKNATISRSLRRAIDASSFPSSIRLITPYTVLVGKSQDVRFAVELKGPSEYSVKSDGNVITLMVVNGPFAEPELATGEKIVVDTPVIAEESVRDVTPTDAPVDAIVDQEEIVADVEVSVPDEVESVGVSDQLDIVEQDMADDSAVQSRKISASTESIYAGQRISLVFDNANIRNILQLIAEVSNLNILAGPGVDGTITLRLIDVPWDQALDLILETNDLGMIRDGNVARILPKESIRAMDEAKFTADRTKEKLENLITEVITVSYTDLSNVAGPSRELLTDRGKITEDSRNKQIIVTDIPKVIEEVRNLVSILDTPEKQVLIEARIVEVSTSANLDLGVKWDVFYSQDASFDPTIQNAGGQVGLGGAFLLPPSAVGNGPSAGIGSTFSWGKVGIDTTVLDLRIGALETSGNGQVVSNPRIMTLNGEQAKISQGTMIPYQTSTGTELKTELVEAALSLQVTPVINPDNTIILDIKATNSAPGLTIVTDAGPSIDTKKAQTKMLVKDSETMVIGGIYVEQDDYSENGVPILMHIPFLGHLFKSSKTNTNRSELMIFITPRIIE